MYTTKEQILSYLTDQAITYQIYTHPPLFTCKQGLEIIQEMKIPGIGIKNLFLKDKKGKLHHIAATYLTKIELKNVNKILEVKELRFANEELLMQHLGVKAGSVTPLALINDRAGHVELILDKNIFEHEFIQIHPLENDATVVIKPENLLIFLQKIQKPYLVYNFEQHKID